MKAALKYRSPSYESNDCKQTNNHTSLPADAIYVESGASICAKMALCISKISCDDKMEAHREILKNVHFD